MSQIEHLFEPVYNHNSRILILGTFPSVKSRETGFYYGHPQNRFWKVLSNIFDCPLPITADEKKQMLLLNHVAVWDVIQSCEIKGSSDSSIKNVVPADLNTVLKNSMINQIFANGKTAEKLYKRYSREAVGFDIIPLPSTSPANAVCSLEKLILEWGEKLSQH